MRNELIRSLDLVQVITVFFLIGLGLASIYSATHAEEGVVSRYYLKQLIVAGVSSLVFFVILFTPTRVFYALSYAIYAFTILLLILVLLFNRGAEPVRWLQFGSFNFQPSEAAKLGMILVLARMLADKKKIVGNLSVTLRAIVLVAIPTLLVVVEPDLGTSATFAFIALPMMLFAGIKSLHLLILLMPFVILAASLSIFTLIPALLIVFLAMFKLKVRLAFALAALCLNIALGLSAPRVWNSMHPYQRQRIITFMNPGADPRGAGYQIIQSKIAVGSGGFLGKGFLRGSQGRLKFLPAGHTDFIFSIFCEEFGFLGAGMVMTAFYLLVYRGILRAEKCHNRFNSLVVLGGASHFAAHALVNIGMAVGLLPVTGIPLPFMSCGGSSLLLNLSIAGLMIGAGMRWREY